MLILLVILQWSVYLIDIPGYLTSYLPISLQVTDYPTQPCVINEPPLTKQSKLKQKPTRCSHRNHVSPSRWWAGCHKEQIRRKRPSHHTDLPEILTLHLYHRSTFPYHIHTVVWPVCPFRKECTPTNFFFIQDMFPTHHVTKTWLVSHHVTKTWLVPPCDKDMFPTMLQWIYYKYTVSMKCILITLYDFKQDPPQRPYIALMSPI